MFTVLVSETPDKKRGPAALWQRLFPPAPHLELCRTLDVPWRLVRAPLGRRGINWAAVAELAGRHRGRLAMAPQLQPPAGGPVAAFQPLAYQRIMAARALNAALQRLPGPPAAVGVIDPEGCCHQAVELLLERAACVMVYTRAPGRYEWFARRLLEQKGAAVVLCRAPAAMDCCAAVLLGGLCPGWRDFVPPGCVVAGAYRPDGPAGAAAAWGFAPRLPRRLQYQVPPGVPAGVLLPALYELSARRELAALPPAVCVLGGREAELEEFISLAENSPAFLRVGGPSPLDTGGLSGYNNNIMDRFPQAEAPDGDLP